MSSKKTLVLGASPNPSRFSYAAVNKLKSHGHPVIAVGKRAGRIGDIEILQTIPGGEPDLKVDTVSLYLNPSHQTEVREAILHLNPRRVIFNPGAENPGFEAELKRAGIHVQEDCTLVLLDTGEY